MTDAENWIETFYRYNNRSVAILPYLNIAYYPSQGWTSIGCMKYQVQFGWLIFGASIHLNHRNP